MSVKAFLAAQRADFISLHDLLMAMVDQTDCSLQEAATMLHQVLRKEPAAAAWVAYHNADGLMRAPGATAPMQRLRYVANNGALEEDMSDDIPF